MPKAKQTDTTFQSNEQELSTLSTTAAENGEAVSTASPPAAEKPKRTVRKKKAETEPAENSQKSSSGKAKEKSDSISPLVNKSAKDSQPKASPEAPILTIIAYDEVQTPQKIDATIWHEIQDAYITRKILTGTLDGIESTESGDCIAVAHYKSFRVIIPITEMTLLKRREGENKIQYHDRLHKLLNRMLGAEIDFIIRGIDPESRSIVASRKDAMLRKRYTFYIERENDGCPRIRNGRKVQARIILVAEKLIHVEIFGVETKVFARDLSWYWIGDARDHYSVGNSILLRIVNVTVENVEKIKVVADARSVQTTTARDMFLQCRVQGKYAGKVTDIQNGVIFIRLSNGVNAIAHSCMDQRIPGKKDDVSFVVTKLDEEWCVAIGMITRIIRQNL